MPIDISLSTMRDLAADVVMSNDERSWMAGNREQHVPSPAEIVALCDEVDRLRDINHGLVTSHNALLTVVVRLEGGQREYGYCACGNPSVMGVAHRTNECLTIGVQPR